MNLGRLLAETNYSLVYESMLDDGTEVMVKQSRLPHEVGGEIAALRHYAGRGAVRLLSADAERGILVLERVRPGVPLLSLWPHDDEEATRVAARVMRRLWRSADELADRGSSKHVLELGKSFAEYDGSGGDWLATRVGAAAKQFETLLATAGEDVVLHGDLHHFNVLSSDREGWLAIDPKGWIGERTFDVGALLSNPIGQIGDVPDLPAILRRRIVVLSEELGFDPRRIHTWAFVHVILSALWSLDEEADPTIWRPVVEAFSSHP